MREGSAIIFSFLAFLALFFSNCGTGGGMVAENQSDRGYNPGVGPFDSHGNYVEHWADDKSKGHWWRGSIGTAVAVTRPETSTPPPVIASHTAPAARPAQPRPTVRVKPKRKPPARYTVRKGDTLWAISRKYKTSVTAIQRANGLKGTHLKISRHLLIPRY